SEGDTESFRLDEEAQISYRSEHWDDGHNFLTHVMQCSLDKTPELVGCNQTSWVEYGLGQFKSNGNHIDYHVKSARGMTKNVTCEKSAAKVLASTTPVQCVITGRAEDILGDFTLVEDSIEFTEVVISDSPSFGKVVTACRVFDDKLTCRWATTFESLPAK